jgi:anaerobic magnesium-protoporphyrin IX monomethyl ester cyclase
MKVLLINPNSRIVESSWIFKKFVSPIPPVGLAYLASVLERNGIEVAIVDQVEKKISDEEIIRRIQEFSPQIVGFSCLTQVINSAELLINKIRAHDKKIKIILGNIHPTLFADELLKDGVADIIVRNEGEVTLLETALAIAENGDLHTIQGISFKFNGGVIHNPDRPLIDDLDQLPYPAWHLFDLPRYSSAPLISAYDISLPILASRGCPFRCIFCSQDKIYKKARYRKIDNIIDEIEYMNDRYKIRNFGFIDPFFPFSIKFGLDFCDRFIERGLHNKIRWVTETRVDLVNLELLKKMKEAGAYLIMYGFEVGNQAILNKLRKGTSIEQSRLAMKYTKKAGLMSLGLFMLGMPGENKETCEETIRFAKELDCDIVKFNIAVPYPGSEFFEENKMKLTKEKVGWERFIAWLDWAGAFQPIYVPEDMNAQELINLQRKAMFSYYMRPRIIFKNIIKRKISLKFLFYGAWVLANSFLKILVNKIKKKTGINP